jgi:hypothetical protein
MADTDLPNGFGAIDRPSGPSRPPRPIASPFGIFPDPWQLPNPSQTPGFNVQPDQASTNPMSSLLASFMPSGQDMRQSIAENLGFPVDAIGHVLHKFGFQVPGNEAPPEWTPSPSGRQPWLPGASVPLSSQNIRAMMDNAPSWAALLQAARRPGLF